MIKYIFKCTFIHLLVAILIDLPAPTLMPFLASNVYAQEEESLVNPPMSELINTYNAMVIHQDFPGILQEDRGKTAMERVQSFIADPANAEELQTANGKGLLGLHNKLARYLSMRKAFDECLDSDDPQYTGGLPERLLESALTMPSTDIPCDPGFFQEKTLEQLLTDVRGIVADGDKEKAQELHNFEEMMHKQSTLNSLRTYVNLEYTYNKDFGSENGTLSEEEVNSIVDEICDQEYVDSRTPGAGGAAAMYGNMGHNLEHYGCKEEEKEQLKEATQVEFETLFHGGAARYSHAEARDDLVGRIRRINEVIDENEFDIEEHTFSESTIDFSTDKSKAAHQNYINGYMREAGEGPGLLMWTDSIGEGRKDKDQYHFLGLINGGFNPRTKKFRPHSTEVTEDDVGDAIAEAKGRVLDQTRHFHSDAEIRGAAWEATLDREANDWNPRYNRVVNRKKESLKDMVKKSPVTAGQVLMKDPSLIDEACEVINGVIEDAKDDEGFGIGDVFMWGGVIVGGALLAATGVGLLAIAAGAAGGLTAVTAVGTMALTAAAYGGMALGVAEMAYFGPQWVRRNQERNELLNSYLSGNGDEHTINEYLEVLDEMEDAKFNFLLAAGFSIFDMSAMATLLRGVSGTQKLNIMRNYRDLMGLVSNNPGMGRKLRTTINLMGGGVEAQQKVGRVLRKLAHLENKEEIIRFLRGLDPEKAKDIFEDGFKVCDEFC